MKRCLFILGFLVATCCAHAQDGVYRERLYVNMDQDHYLAGEWCWFSVYSLDAATDQPRVFSRIAYLELLDAHGTPVVQTKLALDSARAQGAVQLPADLPSGTYTWRAYTRWMRNFSSEGFFTQQVNVYNTLHPEAMNGAHLIPGALQGAPDAALHCSTDKPLYDRRSQLEIRLKTGVPVTGLSLSVFRVDTVMEKVKLSPQAYKHYPLIDTLLPELRGNIITGRIVNRATGTPVEGVIGTLSVPGRKPVFQAVSSDANGRFISELEEAYGNSTLIMECREKQYRIIPDYQFAPVLTPAQEAARDSLPENVLEAYATRHVSAQVEHAYRERDLAAPPAPLRDSVPFFGRPDEEILLDDYTRFTTMEDVFREVIKQVFVRRAGGVLHLHCWNLGTEMMEHDDALVLLDGVPVYNNKELFEFDPLKIRKISVRARPVYYGPIRAAGVVFMQTYSGDLKGYPLDSTQVSAQDFVGLQNPHPFPAPAYVSQTERNSRFPDYRSLLYWQPSVRFDAAGAATVQCYTGDLPGHYLVVAAGLDAGGKPCYTTHAFDVK
ncbi:hypothetical protein DCC81_21820 [Chitinophaga parva]|uniref:TonB-dependent receptor plug domain-containing protein n=1 Tax=Chitinophaga parva TaxID=2169414 RepID=A0A2T7BD87_9BACT|nr:hypothetical protein [Chitinophaga parva]PUZ23045.1 hypothetical protein DCC81_21820 [Chitinophaga parva]